MVDFLGLGVKILKILQNEWRIACTRSALSVLDDEALKDIGLTRVQIWQTEETPCVNKCSKSYPYNHRKVNQG
ncbi:DUF1127 domain-containing protein [Mycoavidus sp. SF9855]|uniref:DUF1127 domain-containing protein n=1 Tax=Mycoavidus sp. SF9855 TaxID=2968475 RepID=UPI0034D25A1B